MATKKSTAKAKPKKRTKQSLSRMPDELTPKQAAFVREYLVDFNATEAATRAGYSCATIGRQLVTHPSIKAAIAAATATAEKRTEVTFDRWINETAGIAFSDIRRLFNDDGTLKAPKDLDDYAAASVSSIEVYEEYAGKGQHKTLVGYTKKVRLWDKLAALEKLAKRFGWLKETPIQHVTNVTVMNDEQRDEILRAAFARVVRGPGSTVEGGEATADESRLALAPPGTDHGDGGPAAGRHAKDDPLF